MGRDWKDAQQGMVTIWKAKGRWGNQGHWGTNFMLYFIDFWPLESVTQRVYSYTLCMQMCTLEYALTHTCTHTCVHAYFNNVKEHDGCSVSEVLQPWLTWRGENAHRAVVRLPASKSTRPAGSPVLPLWKENFIQLLRPCVRYQDDHVWPDQFPDLVEWCTQSLSENWWALYTLQLFLQVLLTTLDLPNFSGEQLLSLW